MPVASATQSASNLPKQLSDNNALGTTLGNSSTDLIGFYQVPTANTAGGVAQPAGNAQAQPVRGAQAGIVTTYSSYQTAFASAGVATITTTEAGLTVMQGTVTSARVLVTSGDMLYINKPTSQAGLGVGNVRVSASNVLGVTISNPTAATITPSVNQVYTIVAIRGLPTIAATLSPAAVAPNAIVEQTFTIVPTAASPQGIPVGALVQVMKPTAQAGLDIVGCRAVSNNVVGITFANVTAATITPTASESYTIQALQALDAHNNFMVLTLNGGAVGAIGAEGGIITGGTTAFAGVLATDIPVGPPYAPTAANNGLATTNSSSPAVSIRSANTMTMWFNGIGTASTPTANVSWDQVIYRLNPTAPLVIYNTSLAPTSVAANTTAEQTFTVTGLLASSAVWVNKPTPTAGLGIAGVRVSALNTLAINYINSTSAAIVPPTETYVIGNFQQLGPGATTSNTSGGAVSQPCVNVVASNAWQLAKLRSDLVALGLWAGA
jgi:hypothetical protein